MSEDAGEEPQATKEITFNIKSSSDAKYVLTVPESMTVSELKEKLATSDYADIEASRQRLIYSGRVLKDPDTLSVYKIKDGNTVHLVRGAASNQRQNPASQGSSAVPPNAGVPTNFATGTGTDPLAGLTGARYAGFAQLPGADQFGADGGVSELHTTQHESSVTNGYQMGAPQGPDDMLRMMENPMFQSQMNEALNNPHVIQMMQNSPMVRNNPMLRQMLQNPEMRRMMMDPQIIRQSMNMQRQMGLGGQGQSSMPAPGVTDTTPGAATGGGTTATPQQTNTTGTPSTSPSAQNPFAALRPNLAGGPGAGRAPFGNDFAALFGGGAGSPGAFANTPNPTANSNSTSPPAGQTSGQDQAPNPQQQQAQPPNPFAGLFGAPPANQQQNPIAQMAQQMMQNPEMMRMAMQQMGLGGQGQGGEQGTNPMGMFGGADPFAMFGGGAGTTPQPADTRPPEEQYAEQLRQLNEMGFYEFERNVRALRMAGGNVQGAVEVLLGGGV